MEVEGGEGKRGGVEKGGEVEGRKNEMHNRHSTHTHSKSRYLPKDPQS